MSPNMLAMPTPRPRKKRATPRTSGVGANAQAIQKIANAIQSQGGMDAVNLKVAEQYVGAFSNLAKQGNTLIVPSNLSDLGTAISSALTIVKNAGAASGGKA